MPLHIYAASLLSLVLSGAIFGFFYAWICSTMWGLDAADPRVAIAAMQAMNESVRNAVFAPAFFATPFLLLGTAALLLRVGLGKASLAFALGGVVYLIGGMVLTMLVNVPMNEALAAQEVPATREDALAVWQDYSPRWQVFNVLRTVASGVTLALVGVGLLSIRPMPG